MIPLFRSFVTVALLTTGSAHAENLPEGETFEEQAKYDERFPRAGDMAERGIVISDQFCQSGLDGFVMAYQENFHPYYADRVKVVVNTVMKIGSREVPFGAKLALRSCLD